MYASYLNFKIIYWRTFQKVHFGCSPKSHITNILTEINYDIFLFFLPTFDIMPIFSFSLYLNSFLIYIYMWVRSGRPAFWYCHFLMNFKQMAELVFFFQERSIHINISAEFIFAFTMWVNVTEKNTCTCTLGRIPNDILLNLLAFIVTFNWCSGCCLIHT